jgi:hypothetical protein
MAKSTAKGHHRRRRRRGNDRSRRRSGRRCETGKSRFSKAVEDAASAEKLKGGDRARSRLQGDRDRKGRRLERGREALCWAAKEKAISLATDGKSKASDALTVLGKTISDTAGTIDETGAIWRLCPFRRAQHPGNGGQARIEGRFRTRQRCEGIRPQKPRHCDRHRRCRRLLLARLVRGSGDGDA